MIAFKYGLQAQYDVLEIKDKDTLYFVEDSARLYKGSVLMSEQVIFENSIPEFENAKTNRLYVVVAGDEISLYVKGVSGMQQIGGAIKTGGINNIAAFDDSVLTKIAELAGGKLPTDDNTIPTSGAVQGAIDAAVQTIQNQLDTLDPQVKASINGVSVTEADDPSKFRLAFSRNEGEPINIDLDKEKFLQSAKVSEDGTKVEFTVVTVDGEETVIEIPLNELLKVDASTVKTTQTITVTTPVGNFTKGQTIEVTDIQSILTQMLTKDSNPTTTQPSASITLTGAGAKEVGTEFTPSYSANLNIGSYSNNKNGAQPTGVTAQTWTVTDTNSGSASTQTGSFTKFTVEDSTNYKVSVSVTHSAGNVPTTFLGSPYPDGQIKAGTKTASSAAVTGYRNCWWGFKGASNLIADPTAITAAEIKALGNANRNKPTSLSATDMQQIFIAVPTTTSKTNSLAIVDDSTKLPVTVHYQGTIKVNVGGVNDYNPIEYKVFCSNNASPAPGTTTYVFTWA